MRAWKLSWVALLVLLMCRTAHARDEFDSVKCGSDIPRALIGKTSLNRRVSVTEARHVDLGLVDLGSTEISNSLSSISWRICGSEFELLVDTKKRMIRDVISFPTHSARSPMFIGYCEKNQKKVPEAVVAVLDNRTGASARDKSQSMTLLKANAAWKIDESKKRFVAMPTDGLTCPLSEIITADGGP